MSGGTSHGRKWAGRVLLLAFLAGGIVLWRHVEPLEVFLAFDMAPTLATDDGPPLTRGNLRELKGRVLDGEGEIVSEILLELPAGIRGPVTPPVVLRLPRGDYRIHLRLRGRSGQTLTRQLPVTLDEDGYQHISL